MNKSMHYLLQTKTLSRNYFSRELYDMDRNLKQKKQPWLRGRKLLLLSFLILFSLAGSAQNQTVITGTVTDSSGTNPLLGVTVAANDSKKTTTTGNNGTFSLTVTSADKKLTFSYVGMKTVTKSLNGENNFTYSMTKLEYQEWPLMRVSALVNLLEVNYDQFEEQLYKSHDVSKAIIEEFNVPKSNPPFAIGLVKKSPNVAPNDVVPRAHHSRCNRHS